MRIVDVREIAAPISSPISNACIDFSGITCSLAAVVTGVMRNGRTVIALPELPGIGCEGKSGLIRLMPALAG